MKLRIKMMKNIRYGKSIKGILDIKKPFLDENECYLEKNQHKGEIYKKQPYRVSCKLCRGQLPREKYFSSHGITYFLCDNCGHLNGEFQDSNDFADAIYQGSYGELYKMPTSEEYFSRMDSIYTPKALFLVETLEMLKDGGDCPKTKTNRQI